MIRKHLYIHSVNVFYIIEKIFIQMLFFSHKLLINYEFYHSLINKILILFPPVDDGSNYGARTLCDAPARHYARNTRSSRDDEQCARDPGHGE